LIIFFLSSNNAMEVAGSCTSTFMVWNAVLKIVRKIYYETRK